MPTVLVADDNTNIQKMVALALKDLGVGVVGVGNGEAAVRKLPDVTPDLVLADIFMPVRNGYEVCEFIKKDSRFAHIPVILLVGAFDPLDDQEAQRVGADGVLKKPFVPPEPLVNIVRTALEKSGALQKVPVNAPIAVTIPMTPEPAAPDFPPPPREAPAAAPAAPAEPWPEMDLPPEEYATRPWRLALGEDDKPLAFGEMLHGPAEASESKPGNSETSRFAGADLGEERAWGSVAENEEPETSWGHTEPVLPRREEAELLRPFEEQPVAETMNEATAPPGEISPPAESFYRPLGGRKMEEAPSGNSPLPSAAEQESPIPLKTGPASPAVDSPQPSSTVEQASASMAPPPELAEPVHIPESAPPASEPAEIEPAAPVTADSPAAQDTEAAETQSAAPPGDFTPPGAEYFPGVYTEEKAIRPGFLSPESEQTGWSELAAEVHAPEPSASAQPPAIDIQPPPESSVHVSGLSPTAASKPLPEEFVPGYEDIGGGAGIPMAELASAITAEVPAALSKHAAEPPAPAAEATPSDPAPTPSESAAGSTPSAEVAQQTRAEVVEEVVARVMQRMKPDVLDAMTRDLLKPIVEALVQRELEKK